MSTKTPQTSEWHLAQAVEHELDELVHHPRQELHRLREEAESGESGVTLAIILTGVVGFAALAVLVLLVVTWLSAGGL
jgi:hypothetical protein